MSTPTYVIEIVTATWGTGRMAWDVRGRNGCKGCGAPNAKNLGRYVEAFEASTRAGGANEHLGEAEVVWAAVSRNYGGSPAIAEYRKG